MTIADLKTVCQENTVVTVATFDGRHWMAKTYEETPIEKINGRMAQLEIIYMFIGDGTLYIDVKEVVEGDEQDAAD